MPSRTLTPSALILQRRRLSLSLALTLAAAALVPSVALAQANDRPAGNVNLSAFHHAMDSRGYLTLNASQVLGHKEFSFGLVTDWGYKLLEFEANGATMAIN